MLTKQSTIFVTGHKGLVGSSVLRKLNSLGYSKIYVADKKKLDLRNQKKVDDFFKKKKINAVINCAGKVGGIYANNKYRADFIYDNIAIQNNIIYSCFKHKVKNLIFLGSSCIYPKNCKQPIKEKYLLTGPLEYTNEPYEIAKIAGIKMCEAFNSQYKTNYKCLMPCNLYGPNDKYDLNNSHFLPALISKIHKSKSKKNYSITVWGNGTSKRELMFVDDLADACIYFLKKKTKETLINIGTGKEKKIIDYVYLIKKKIKSKAKITFDLTKPNGTPRKVVDISLAKKYGWISKTSFNKGFEITYQDFLSRFEK